MARYTAYLSLGSNLGPRDQQLDDAVACLIRTPGIHGVRESQRHITAPVGNGYSGEFLNSAVSLDCDLTATDLLIATQAIEKQLGRDRRQADRTVDIDILLMRDADYRWLRHTTNPVLPHPRMHTRAFVLVPLRELLNPALIEQALCV